MPAPAALPVTTTLAPAQLSASLSAAAATGPVTPIPNSGNASNPDWGRRPGGVATGTFSLYVSVDAPGKGAGGSVSSTPAGIKCGRDCTEVYASGTRVQLTATPKKGSTFAGWSDTRRSQQ